MCGVFGFVSFNGKGPSIERLAKIAAVTERRGKHAFGLAWVDSKGRIKSYKQTGKITDSLGILELAHDAQFLIGHCRYATHGKPDNNLNNHPHPVDGGWFVHNGVIADYNQIIVDHDLHPVSACDSEVLGLMIEQGDGRLRKRCVEAIQYASGTPLVFLGVWSRPGRLIALRSGNPLSVGLCKGRAYLASLQEGLPGKVLNVRDNAGIDFTDGVMKDIGPFAHNTRDASGDDDEDVEVNEFGHPVKVKKATTCPSGDKIPGLVEIPSAMNQSYPKKTTPRIGTVQLRGGIGGYLPFSEHN